MMKRKKIVALFACVGCFCLATGMAISERQVSAATLGEVNLATHYGFGATIQIPSAKITVDGVEYDSQSHVLLPNGEKYRLDEVFLSQVGEYTVVYETVVNGKKYACEEKFSVTKDNYNPEMTSYENGALTITFDKDHKRFDYGAPINLTGATIDDIIVDYVIKLTDDGKYPTNEFKTILTDAYDPDNYITFHSYIGNHTAGMIYSSGSYGKYPSKGAYKGTYDSEIHIGEYGLPTSGAEYRALTGSFSMNYGERILYASDQIVFKSGGRMVCDFDDTVFYKTGWKGFTTGEAYVSFVVEDFLEESASLVVRDLYGEDLSTVREIEDTSDPLIVVDYGEYGEKNLPKGAKGALYPAFEAVAWDVNGCNGKKLAPRVYYNYYSSAKSEIDVVNGYFATKRAGNYSLVYTAEDFYGNRAEKVVTVFVEENIQPIEIVLGETEKLYSVGKQIALPALEVNGAIGEYSLQVWVENGVTETEIFADENGNYVFKPLAEGSYIAKYTVKDSLLRETTEEITVQVTVSDKPIFTSDVIFPKYLYEGFEFTPPTRTAYDYASKQEVEVEVYLTDKNGTAQVQDACAPVVENSCDFVTFTYKAGDTEESYQVPVVKAGDAYSLKMEKFFITNDSVTTKTTENSVQFTATKDEKIVFSNKLLAENFSVKLDVLKSYNNYRSLDIYLYDSKDKNIALKFSFEKYGANMQMYVNDGDLGYGLSSSFIAKANEIYLSFQNSLNQVKIDGKTLYTLSDLSGKEFNGFPSQFVNLEFVMNGVRGTAGFEIYSISKQIFSNESEEYLKPSYYIDGSYGGTFTLNDVYTLNKIFAGDVFSSQVILKYTFTAPDNTVVRAKDGTLLKNVDGTKVYDVVLSQYGSYKFSMSISDGTGNTLKLTYLVNVIDVTKPEILLKSSAPTTGKVGKTVKLPQATVTDESQVGEVYVCVILPDGTTEAVANYKFTPTMKGVYKVCYYAFDSEYNMAIFYADITVK